MMVFEEQLLDTIADALVETGYLVLDDAIPASLQGALRDVMADEGTAFKAAGIGRQDDFQVAQAIRADQIHWITPDTPATQDFLTLMESLRIGLNRRLFMGLFDYESHFAVYPPGAFYKKHRDAFSNRRQAGRANRLLSTVLYLNTDWQQEQGGELVIYSDDDNELEKITPIAGRLVIFLSEKFPHEVLPATHTRRSIAGWFRFNEGTH